MTHRHFWRREWTGQHRLALQRLAEAIEMLSHGARENAERQREASRRTEARSCPGGMDVMSTPSSRSPNSCAAPTTSNSSAARCARSSGSWWTALRVSRPEFVEFVEE